MAPQSTEKRKADELRDPSSSEAPHKQKRISKKQSEGKVLVRGSSWDTIGSGEDDTARIERLTRMKREELLEQCNKWAVSTGGKNKTEIAQRLVAEFHKDHHKPAKVAQVTAQEEGVSPNAAFPSKPAGKDYRKATARKKPLSAQHWVEHERETQSKHSRFL